MQLFPAIGRRFSIRQKIITITLLTCAVVAVLFAIAAATTEYRARRDALTESLSSAARMVGLNASAALTFGDREAAAEVLAALRAQQDVLGAQIYDNTGKSFVSFSREDAAAEPGAAVTLREPILVGTRSLGSLEIRASLVRLQDAIVRQAILLVSTMALTLLIAYAVAARLQRWITGPIDELATVVRQVGAHQDYGARARKSTEDELGVLIDGFNGMLEQIQQRDAALGQIVNELKLARDSAEAASLAKSRFLATMSHEIRTPMNGVLGMAELLATTELSDKQRHYARTIAQSGSALLHIINDVLDFSKIEAGKMTLDAQAFSPRELVEGVAALLASRAREKQVRLAICLDGDLPTQLTGDVNRLRQILLNLLGNAIKFTPSGSVIIRVQRLTSGAASARLRFEIQDSGIGISADALKHVFEPFTQADSSTTRRFGGTGLGLAICRQLVQLMGGTLAATSEEGQGACFYFELELPWTDDLGITETRRRNDLSGLSVLVCDTLADEAEFLGRQLEMWGMNVEVVGQATDADALIDSRIRSGQRYDLLLVDSTVGANALDALQVRIAMQGGDPAGVVVLAPYGDPTNSTADSTLVVAATIVAPVLVHELFAALELAARRGLRSPRNVPAAAPNLTPKNPIVARVLLAEDNAVNQLVCMEMLRILGCESIVVDNGRAALEYVERAALLPDVVLMDVQMPEMDGLAATAAIRALGEERRRQIPIIALTANAMQGDRDMCLKAGMDDYLSKPFERAELEATLRRWVADGSTKNAARAPALSNAG